MRTLFNSLDLAIAYQGERLHDLGHIIKTEKWQGVDISQKPQYEFLELLNVYFQSVIPYKNDLVEIIKPNLPWADVHFAERVSGIPYNPPPSNEIWPFAVNGNAEFKSNEKFSHTYPERFWPKLAGKQELPKSFLPAEVVNTGIRFMYGDLTDVINLLYKEPNTRQAFLPIWFPEDTGSVEGQRVPCTIGYHFIQRFGKLHITYYIRSCDYLRHFRDDIYMACLLVYHILDTLRKKWNDEMWFFVEPGTFSMQIVSLHVFAQEKRLLLK